MEHETETEGSRKQDRHEEEEGENDEAVGTVEGEKEKIQHGDSRSQFSSLAADPELRLVLLGRTGAGKSAAGNFILGREVFGVTASEGAAGTCECESRTATVAGRKLTVVDTPNWFCSELSPEDVQRQIVSCQALVAPGPHAFLLCVPVDQPASIELQGLEALEMVFGRGAVGRHTLVLFTHADRLPAGVTLEEYVSDRERQDLLKLVESCGDHYHTLERGREGGGGGEGQREEGQEKRSVEELLEKVEQVVLESGVDFHAWPAKDKPEIRSKGLRRDREGEQETARRPDSLSLSSPIEPPERGQEFYEEPTPPPESESTEAHDDDLTEGDEDAALAPTPAGPPPSFLRGLWDTLIGWICSVPRLVRGSALLGALVGFFVGGPVGSMLGVTVGSVATEVGRRKRVKKTQ